LDDKAYRIPSRVGVFGVQGIDLNMSVQIFARRGKMISMMAPKERMKMTRICWSLEDNIIKMLQVRGRTTTVAEKVNLDGCGRKKLNRDQGGGKGKDALESASWRLKPCWARSGRERKQNTLYPDSRHEGELEAEHYTGKR
jgi:hypothetical protein